MDYEQTYYIVASTALIFGLAGALWKWLFAEMLRQRTEDPALEGKITVSTIQRDDVTCTVTVVSAWSNPSPRKIYLDQEHSKIRIYELDQFKTGPVDLASDETKWLYEHAPYNQRDPNAPRQYSSYIFYEPGTESEFSATFILPNKKTYAARALIQMDDTRMRTEGVFWSREIAFST